MRCSANGGFKSERSWGAFYLSHFYRRLGPALHHLFSFEDSAGVYTENGQSRLFAVCIRYTDMEGLRTLPAGWYLCADCTKENRENTLFELTERARQITGTQPAFQLARVILSGILQGYDLVQIYLGD